MKNFLLFLFLFLTMYRSSSQSPTTDYADALRLIDSWIEAQRDYSDLPSIAVAIVKDQETIWSKAYGLANIDGKVAASTSTLYSICSISKLFTSVAIMQLYDAGKLRLDDIVDSILPNYNL